ncbi:4-deoxy-L-threo-5-hexosulose-uronate ketol-isomerase [Salana multivorans]|uniref:5-dehydro-4-deoxy-D-glucuronate isomerase n=1 Tax=Salana multivorans TaxID=120377 RepID=A0A3N2DB26_9MICO|nr:5-dehydro-4-deoxy-D-glucuronate isomerase [Salana multivorans]MBN8883365.1 5-dehydro-4-deoxy-D-glucuronate isomerase [Salana multivorans]OJX96117.1 MAG: 5-dehydro-4-deoxy-D-glucuronate isomerase [Micrococcales bacterium 73-15]ROR97010.1 4-deoxy-L-threo-5-hexosulose-uronate ketol-isomerase [Salana multivorans]
MRTIDAASPAHVATLDTDGLREAFLAEDLFVPGRVSAAYLLSDRIAVVGAVPLDEGLRLPTYDQLRSETFLQRREAGVLNLGGAGAVTVDGERYELATTGSLYVGRGAREVVFTSDDADDPAAFYLFSATAHLDLPTTLVTPEAMNVVEIGSEDDANRRTLHQCIYEGGTRSAQIAFGFTTVHRGSVWNTMPAHTHARRTECYLYFDLAPQDRVFHVMGEPSQTRHLVVADRTFVFSPPWSLHTGVGTGPYSFVWATAGENTTYDDMDAVPVTRMR